MNTHEVLNTLADDMRNTKYNAERELSITRDADKIQTLRAQVAILEAYLFKIRDLKQEIQL
jgi:hypothetical protein